MNILCQVADFVVLYEHFVPGGKICCHIAFRLPELSRKSLEKGVGLTI